MNDRIDSNQGHVHGPRLIENPPPSPRRLEILDQAWRTVGHGRRLAAVKEAAPDLRAKILDGDRVLCVRTLPLSRFPYPTKHAFDGAAWHPSPLLEMAHRCLLVQFRDRGALRTLLWNPTDVDGAKRTPFFARILSAIPAPLHPYLLPRPAPSLESQLAQLGLDPGDIDYVAFDHFHTQDLRRLLGTSDAPGARFPRAQLIAPRVEWDDWAALHPMQRAWYVADGRDGADTSRVHFTDGDVQLGDGVVIARTPGHTSGNQTLFIAAPDGIWGCAENGTCADAYAPEASRIPGLRRHARAYGIDLIQNHNTPELGADQYTSMALERAVVDRARGSADFFRMFPSSEVVHSALAPGLFPTHSFGAITVGDVVTRAAARARA
jgi:hypothetical protein